MRIIRLAQWHLPELDDARFYGWRYALSIGPFMVFFGAMDGELPATQQGMNGE